MFNYNREAGYSNPHHGRNFVKQLCSVCTSSQLNYKDRVAHRQLEDETAREDKPSALIYSETKK